MFRWSVAMLIAILMRMANADAPSADAVDVEAARAIDALRPKFACELSVHGEPRFDEFSGKWLVAYMASGAKDCDAAALALQQAGTNLSITFYRRPDREQVEHLVVDLRQSVRAAFGCNISIVGEPQFDETSASWSVTYLAAGAPCDDAAQELSRRGAELQINFLRRASRQDLIR